MGVVWRADDDDDGGGLRSLLKCRCLPSWCRLRRTKLEVLLVMMLIGGCAFQRQQEASYLERLETQEGLTEAYMRSASCEHSQTERGRERGREREREGGREGGRERDREREREHA